MIISKCRVLLLLSAAFAVIACLSGGPQASHFTPVADSARYRIDAAQSRFTVRAFAGGFLSAFAHDHTIAIRDFAGHADFTYGTVEPASLEMTIKAASLEITDKVSTSDRQKIEGTMRDEVLEIAKYPDISFKSTSVSASKTGEGQYQARIVGRAYFARRDSAGDDDRAARIRRQDFAREGRVRDQAIKFQHQAGVCCRRDNQG